MLAVIKGRLSLGQAHGWKLTPLHEDASMGICDSTNYQRSRWDRDHRRMAGSSWTLAKFHIFSGTMFRTHRHEGLASSPSLEATPVNRLQAEAAPAIGQNLHPSRRRWPRGLLWQAESSAYWCAGSSTCDRGHIGVHARGRFALRLPTPIIVWRKPRWEPLRRFQQLRWWWLRPRLRLWLWLRLGARARARARLRLWLRNRLDEMSPQVLRRWCLPGWPLPRLRARPRLRLRLWLPRRRRRRRRFLRRWLRLWDFQRLRARLWLRLLSLLRWRVGLSHASANRARWSALRGQERGCELKQVLAHIREVDNLRLAPNVPDEQPGATGDCMQQLGARCWTHRIRADAAAQIGSLTAVVTAPQPVVTSGHGATRNSSVNGWKLDVLNKTRASRQQDLYSVIRTSIESLNN